MSEVVPVHYATLLEVSLDDPEVKLTKQDVFDILLGANYLGAMLLVHLACATIASWAKCKTPKEMMEEFGVDESQITPEIEAACKLENEQYEKLQRELKEEYEAMNNPQSTSTASASALETPDKVVNNNVINEEADEDEEDEETDEVEEDEEADEDEA
jgi:hypothetical protein